MPTFNERLKTQNRKLAEKQKQLDKLNKTVETARESIKAIETGTFIPEKPPDSKSSTENSTDNTLTEKEVTDEVSGSGKALGGS